ncbi:MAG: uracil-DNA glycosylase [Candidatus Diapherotrites archaeon]
MSIIALHEKCSTCQLCPLGKTRSHAVPGEGPSTPSVMLIGEAPGRNEDEQGRPFCGAAGKKLDMLLENAGLQRSNVFITSVVKCRPPNNRVPTENEAFTCKSTFLLPQIQLLKPVVIGLMGRTAIQHVLGEDVSLTQMHGKIITHNGQQYVILYHPAAMIYNASLQSVLEKDFKELGVFLRTM